MPMHSVVRASIPAQSCRTRACAVPKSGRIRRRAPEHDASDSARSRICKDTLMAYNLLAGLRGAPRR